ncbi:hypothetical protein K7567_06190 [Stenotrophomonas maltophilia]|nr:hypothetical protein K7567_06190 [Stenotrophomonas maltophilia]
MHASATISDPNAVAAWMKSSSANARSLDAVFETEADEIKAAAFSSDCCGSNNYEER